MARRLIVLVTVLGLALALAATALGATVTVRVEGKTQPIFGSVPVKVEAPNALVALDAASTLGEFYFGLTSSSFGTYVSQIGRYPAAGAAGWVFKVNGVSPPVGADQVVLKDGDEVLWYYATFGATGGPKTLVAQGRDGELLHGHGLRRRRQVDACRRGPGAGRRPQGQGRRQRPGLRRQARRPRAGVRRRRRPVERREVIRARFIAPLLAALALSLAGCGGVGPTAADGTAQLWVTRDRGSEVLVDTEVPAGQTLLRALRSKAKVSTRYGGGFVQSIDGVEGSARRHEDWFWFVNGLAGDRSATSYRLRDGDVAWWDYRDWSGDAATLEVVAGRVSRAVPARLRRQDAAGSGALRAGPPRRRPSRSREASAPTTSRRWAPPSPADANLFELVAGRPHLTAAHALARAAGRRAPCGSRSRARSTRCSTATSRGGSRARERRARNRAARRRRDRRVPDRPDLGARRDDGRSCS